MDTQTKLLLSLPSLLPEPLRSVATGYTLQLHRAAQLMNTTWRMEAVISTWEVMVEANPAGTLEHDVITSLLLVAGEPGEGTREEVVEILDALDLLCQIEGAGSA